MGDKNVACEQALLFGRVKHVSRERASERRSREGQRKGPSAPSAPRSRVLARLASLAQIANRKSQANKNGGGHTHRGKVTQVSYLSIDK